jgi:hypothetical protein
VAEPAPKSSDSICDYCEGVFSAAYQRSSYCQSCGKGKHWERGADHNAWALNARGNVLIKDKRGRVRPRYGGTDSASPNDLWPGFCIGLPDNGNWRRLELSFEIEGADGFYDIDGTWLPAAEILDSGARNYGRKRAFSCPNDGGSATTVYWQDLGGEAEKIDWLVGDSWHVRKEGSSGRRRGRRTRGITDPATIDALFQTAASIASSSVTDFKWTVKGGRPSRARQQTRDWFSGYVHVLRLNGANVEVLATMLDCHRDTVYTLAVDGGKLRQKETNRGEERAMNAASLKQLRSDIKTDLEAALERERAEIFRVLYAFHHGETPAEAWVRVLREDADDRRQAA